MKMNITGQGRAKRALSLLLAVSLLMVLMAACGSGASSTEGTASGQSRPPVQIKGNAPASSSVALNAALLTGLEKGPGFRDDRRITAVMVNNIARSRPTRGLTDAKVIYEIKVEGGITRMMALYEDYETMPTVGGVRSARDQFLQLLLPFWGFLVHDGPAGSHPVNWMMDEFDYREFSLQPNSGVSFRLDRPGMASEFTLYTDGEHIANAIKNTGADDFRQYSSTMFNFVPYTQPPRQPEAGAAEEVAVIHSTSYRSFFQYNAGEGRYAMSQFNSSNGKVENTVDENNNQQLAFDNVLVLFAPMREYDNSPLIKVDYSNGGGGYYFSQGRYEPIVWRKGAANRPLMLERADKSGNPVVLNTGTSYIAIVDDKEMDAFYAHLMSGKGNAALQTGTVNQNEADAAD